MNRDQPAGYYEIMRHFIAGIALLGLALPASAQVAVVDEGSFTISHNGSRIGREEFAIRRTPNPGGDVLVANATVVYTDRRVSPALQTDAAGAPLRYQVEVSAAFVPEPRELPGGEVEATPAQFLALSALESLAEIDDDDHDHPHEH